MSNTNILHYTCDPRVCRITLNRPGRHNALSTELIAALQEAFTQVSATSEVKVILLRAEGPSFCAGADLSDLRRLQNCTFEDNLADSKQLQTLFQRIYSFPKPVIAEVQGAAIAGGCGLVALCDFVLASEAAVFACPEVRIGFVPAIILPFLLRRIGEAHTRELILSGAPISAARAQEMGLVTRLHQAKQLRAATEELIKQLIEKNSEQSMQLSKQLLYRLQHMSFEEGLQYATHVNASARASKECRLGIQRFLDKKAQDWSQS